MTSLKIKKFPNSGRIICCRNILKNKYIRRFIRNTPHNLYHFSNLGIYLILSTNGHTPFGLFDYTNTIDVSYINYPM